MKQKLLLVDFENLQDIDLSKLDGAFKVIIFVGASQKSVPISVVTNAQKLGSQVEWQRVDANGNNALDFFIACHLGRELERATRSHCVVLSKDKGFDPLLRHLSKQGMKCRRIGSLLELEPATAKQEALDSNSTRVLGVLKKSSKRCRPRKIKTLTQHISSLFQKQLPQTELDRIIGVLRMNGLISESDGTVTYHF